MLCSNRNHHLGAQFWLSTKPQVGRFETTKISSDDGDGFSGDGSSNQERGRGGTPYPSQFSFSNIDMIMSLHRICPDRCKKNIHQTSINFSVNNHSHLDKASNLSTGWTRELLLTNADIVSVCTEANSFACLITLLMKS